MADLLLDWMTVHGVLVLVLALLAQPLGLPIPTGLLVLATGALARQGLVDWRGMAAIGLAAAVAGDCASYALGRACGRWARRHMGSRCRALWLGAEEQLRCRGGRAIYVTHVALTSLGLITNLAAGSACYPLPRFVASATMGRATWVGVYGGLGFFLGSQWPAARQLMDAYGPWLGGAGLGCAGLYLVGLNLSQRRGGSRTAAV